MQNREDQPQNEAPRKPPIPIPERTQQGALYPPREGEAYQGEVLRDMPRSHKDGASKMYITALVILTLIVNGALSFFITSTFAPSIPTVDVIAGQVNANTEAISSLTAPNDGLQARLENVINALGNYAKKTDMSGYVTATQVTSQLNGMMNGYMTQSQVDSLINSAKASLQTDLNAANAKITALENLIKQTPGTSTNTNAVSAKVELQFGQYVILPKTTPAVVTVPIRLTLTNNMDVQAKDVRLAIDFQPGMMQAVTWTAGYPTLAGGTTMWQQPFPSSIGMSFQNGWGLNINANSTIQINLLLTMQIDGTLTTEMYYQPQVTVLDATA